MTKKVSVHWTAPRLACRLLVRSVVNSVQAYWRFATASMAMMQAASWRHRVAPGSEFCGSVMSNSSDNVGQDGILSHGFSSFQGVITRHEGSWDCHYSQRLGLPFTNDISARSAPAISRTHTPPGRIA